MQPRIFSEALRSKLRLTKGILRPLSSSVELPAFLLFRLIMLLVYYPRMSRLMELRLQILKYLKMEFDPILAFWHDLVQDLLLVVKMMLNLRKTPDFSFFFFSLIHCKKRDVFENIRKKIDLKFIFFREIKIFFLKFDYQIKFFKNRLQTSFPNFNMATSPYLISDFLINNMIQNVTKQVLKYV